MPEEIFFVRMEACPEPGSAEFGSAGGAFVNCYVDAEDLRTAELRAIALIQQQGWRPYRFDTWQLTCGDCATDDPPDYDGPSPRELVQQARTDGECCVFHTFPIDAPDVHNEQA